jgi:hypothetical protein
MEEIQLISPVYLQSQLPVTQVPGSSANAHNLYSLFPLHCTGSFRRSAFSEMTIAKKDINAKK